MGTEREPDTAAARTEALVRIGEWLRTSGYEFTTVTPETHARNNRRPGAAEARTLTDVFGWSRPFREGLLPANALALMREADVLEERDATSGGRTFASRVRFSTLDGCLFSHSAYPTDAPDAVFFGPDTYRFARLIRSSLSAFKRSRPARIIDAGCGSGAGGIVAARLLGVDSKLTCADISRKALDHARCNAVLAGVKASFREGDLFTGLKPAEVILANPPYLADAAGRVYRDGGGERGSGLSLRIVDEGLPVLAPRGVLILYTGSLVMEGRDLLRERIERRLSGEPVKWRYEELDPDVFGEELAQPGYEDVERIAAVGVVVERLS